MKDLGLYIHIPFCKAKCFYCDFNSYAGKDDLVPAYFNALGKEVHRCSQQAGDVGIKTVFIGGGTPSSVEARHIYELLNDCHRYLKVGKNAEISIETNPGTLSYEKLTAYRAIGINRLSIGLQAWQDSLLKRIGRVHCAGEFVQNFALARKAGFKNINVDLIFGLPGQTLRHWEETLKNVIALEPAHISAYSLKIEEGTVFGNELEEGSLLPVEDELDREMYLTAVEHMAEAGFKHYEISNFSKPGFECRHNLIYWKAEPYIGIGAGAHSYRNGERYSNVSNIDEYISKLESGEDIAENREIIGRSEEMGEFMLLGLRLIDGVSRSEFEGRFGIDLVEIFGEQVKKLMKKELLEWEGDRIRLTPMGLDLANQVFMEFV